MAIPTAAFPATQRMPHPGTYSGRVPRAAPTHVLARFAFWTILLLSLTNAIGVFITWVRRSQNAEYELSIYPVVFAVCTALVLSFTKGRQRSTLLIVAWVFWLLFLLGGFLGSMQITATDIRSALRVTLKPWMAIVGLPWLALRAISEDKVPRLVHVTVVVGCVGTVIGLIQVVAPSVMGWLSADIGRAEGLWSMPTTSGYICAMMLFLSLAHPFQSRFVNLAVRLILLLGVGASLSRGPIVAMLIAWIVYAISARRFATLLKSMLGLVFFVSTTLVVLGTIEHLTKVQEYRLTAVRSLLSGNWETKTFTDRTELWAPALDAILSKGGLLFGLGHGSMGNIVGKTGEGISPHNYYLYILGNSGLLALFGLLAFHFALFQQAWKCSQRGQQAALLALAVLWALANMVDNGLIDHPTTGAIMACIAVSVAYGRPRDALRHRWQRPNLNAMVRRRPVYGP